MNINFISQCVNSKVVPNGFRLKLHANVPPNTANRAAACDIWASHLLNCSFKLMSLTCAFYATELPDLHNQISQLLLQIDNTNTLISLLEPKLIQSYKSICKRHFTKMQKLGLVFLPLEYCSPLPFHSPLPSPSPLSPPSVTVSTSPSPPPRDRAMSP